MWKVLLKTIFFAAVFFACAHGSTQENTDTGILAMSETGPYSIVERSDWRRYDNGKYTGLTHQEVRASILPKQREKTDSPSNGVLSYQGNYFVLEKTLRDMRQSAQPVDAVIPVSFQVRQDGTINIENDNGYPTLRGYPAFPDQRVMPGFKWRAPGSRAVNPLNSEQPVIIPFNAEYEYQGIERYQNVPVHRLRAAYAAQYQNHSGGKNFSRLQGTHKADILIQAANGLVLFMRDDFDEIYTWADGSTVRFTGFTLTFGGGVVPMDRRAVITSLGKTLGVERLPNPQAIVSEPPPAPPPSVPPASVSPTVPGPSEAEDQQAAPPPASPAGNAGKLKDSAIDMTPVPEGIRLTVKDIRFVPDSADFLPAEKQRLDLIADALKQIPERNFLVEGHTAATGRPAGELTLSVERAKRMVDELVKRGIAADRFIYKGWGGTRPIDNNSTNAGRAQNRRVEITILE